MIFVWWSTYIPFKCWKIVELWPILVKMLSNIAPSSKSKDNLKTSDVFWASQCWNNVPASLLTLGQFTSNVVRQLSTNNEKNCAKPPRKLRLIHPQNLQQTWLKVFDYCQKFSQLFQNNNLWDFSCSALPDPIQLRGILSHLWDCFIPFYT